MDNYKKLINEVKKHKLLYDKFHEDFTNEEKKKLVWEDIGFSTDMTGERAKKKWENIHNAYLGRKKSAGRPTDLLDFLEADGNKISSPFNETSYSSVESPKKMNLAEQTSTPKSKKRKRGDKSYAEVEINQTEFCGSPPVNISTTSVAVQDDIDCFCQLIAVRMKTLPDPQVKSIKRQILEILHRSEIESL